MTTTSRPKNTLERAAIKRFRKEVCGRSESIDPYEDLDWYAMSIGFFLALGIPIDDAARLASWARYDQQYWQP